MEQSYIYEHTIKPDNSIIRLRNIKIIMDDGEIIIGNPNIKRIRPIDDYSDEAAITQNICNLIFTQDVIDNFVEYNFVE